VGEDEATTQFAYHDAINHELRQKILRLEEQLAALKSKL
jgi:hypothetical protein